jgi:hypothetical protein
VTPPGTGRSPTYASRLGVDKTLIEAWIEVGRQRATSAATLTHKACVLAE